MVLSTGNKKARIGADTDNLTDPTGPATVVAVQPAPDVAPFVTRTHQNVTSAQNMGGDSSSQVKNCGTTAGNAGN